MVAPPTGLTTRPPSADEITSVFAVIEASQEALHGEADLTVADLRASWARPSFDPARDAVVLLAGDDLVAYGEVHGAQFGAVVHPSVQGRGVGGWLMQWGLDVVRGNGAATVEVTAADLDARLTSLLTAASFERRWSSWLFWQGLSDDSPAPAGLDLSDPVVVPAGLRLRNPDPAADAKGLYDLIETAFSSWPDREPATFEDWRTMSLDHEETELRTSWLLEDEAGRVVAAAMSMTDRGWGWLAELAVVEDRRGQGLGSILQQQCLRSYRDLGLHTGGLGTDSRTGARGLYERNGFVVQRSFTRWSLPLG